MSTQDGFAVLDLAWTQFWQVSLLIVALLAVVRLAGRSRPHLAHALLLIVLVKCVTPPLWSSSTGLFSRLQSMISQSAVNQGDMNAVRDPWQDSVVETESLQTFVPSSAADEKLRIGQDTFAFGPFGLQEEQASLFEPTIITGLIWAAGLLLVGLVGGVRLWMCLRRIRNQEQAVSLELQALVKKLSRRFRLRRHVRLQVSDSAFGPAVFGILRPTIVLPKLIIDGRSVKQIEPVIAHELIHLRRGDLWCGLLQTLSRLVWWFHPLVHLASRRLSREAEACCDQETIRTMQYEPAEYARCLLDVLELKRQLTPVPVFPGVRPVQITSKRLEQIMQTGQGSPKRCPWWCHAAFLVGAVLTVPGAEFVSGEDVRKGTIHPAYDDATAAALRAEAWQPIPADSEDPGPVTIRSYDGRAALRVVMTQLEKEEARAIEHLLSEIRAFCEVGQKNKGKQKPSAVQWMNGQLVVRASRLGHRHIEDRLSQIAANGFAQITVDAWIVMPSKKILKSLEAEWRLQESESSEDANQIQQAEFERVPQKLYATAPKTSDESEFRATSTVRSRMPVMHQTLSQAEADRFLSRLGDDAKSTTLRTPRVTTFNGQQAMISDAVVRPFVTGLKNGSPQITTINEGMNLKLVNRVTDRNAVRLDAVLTLSGIEDVKTTRVFSQPGKKSVTLQQPIVRTARLETATTVESGKTLLLGGITRLDSKGESESLLVMIRPQIISDDLLTTAMPKPVAKSDREVPETLNRQDLAERRRRTESDNAGSKTANVASIRVYPVADLVVPHPRAGVIEIRGNKVGSVSRPKAAATLEHKELIDLITSVVGSSEWEAEKGPGSIQFNEATLSLVVRQTDSAHAEIVELINELRRLQDVQVGMTVGLLHLTDDAASRIGRSGQFAEKEAQAIRKKQIEKSSETTTAPKLTLFNGDEVKLRFVLSDGTPLSASLQSVISSDRRLVRITGRISGPAAAESGILKTVNVRDGNTLLLDVTDAVNEPSTEDASVGAKKKTAREFGRIYITVEPNVIIREEEEELLGIEIRSAPAN